MCQVCSVLFFFFFKQKTAYEMRISDWSSDVCSSDLLEKRRAALEGKVAVIKVGGATETEIEEKKFRVDDAVAAVKAALEDGIEIGRASCRERVCQYV